MSLNPYAAPAADVNLAVDPQTAEAPLASRGARFGANLIDTFMAYAPFFIAGIVSGHDNSGGIGLTIGALLTLGLVIYQSILVSTTGQTLAKRWLGIRIVKMDGSPVNFVSGVLLRFLVGRVLLFIVPLYSLIDAIWIFKDESRCLHDMIASTKVVVAK
jgi:uncharacterized RDD family membrane protein YckC